MRKLQRRDFIRALGTASAGVVLPSDLFGTIVLDNPVSRKLILLDKGWYLKELDPARYDTDSVIDSAKDPGPEWMPVKMPAQVHDVLFAHGQIPDPHVGKNAAQCSWVSEKDWAYTTSFSAPAGKGPVILRLDGLDTVVAVYLNGEKIGEFNNMHRRYKIDLRSRLNPENHQNNLVFIFHSPRGYMDYIREKYGIVQGIAEKKYLRKSFFDFSSYMGARPNFIKTGIFHHVVLDVPGKAWIEDVGIRTQLSDDLDHAEIMVSPEIRGTPSGIRWALTDPAGKTVSSGKSDDTFTIPVENPMLWWPHTHGTPHLYSLKLDCYCGTRCCDSREFTVGIRSINPVLENPETGEKRFAFRINGKMVFLQGACWAPLEGMTSVWRTRRALRLLELTEHGRMNAYRIWGEGFIPPREFYDECDRRGILVWQDFMFGPGMHPDHVPEFLENCKHEIADTIKRLRNHACLLMYCGGNENLHFAQDIGKNEYVIGSKLFTEVMPAICAELDPDRHFHTSSPCGGPYPNYPLEGDWHDYSTVDFIPGASVPTFSSEVCRTSAPSLSSLRKFIPEDELWPDSHDPRNLEPGKPVWPDMWSYRSTNGSWGKIGCVEDFCDPQNAKDLIRVLGIAHGEYLQRRVERERRGVPDGQPDGKRRCWGNLVWRLNDSWPIIYHSVIDYYLEPKIAYYYLRRSYQPVLVSFERTPDNIFAWVINDSREPVEGELHVTHRDFKGDTMGEMHCSVELKSGRSKRCLDLSDFRRIRLRDHFLQGNLRRNDGRNQAVSFLLIGERYLHLPEAEPSVKYADGQVEISTDIFVRQISLEIPGTTGAVFEDNFFDLVPGTRKRIRIIDPAGGRKLKILALNSKALHLDI